MSNGQRSQLQPQMLRVLVSLDPRLTSEVRERTGDLYRRDQFSQALQELVDALSEARTAVGSTERLGLLELAAALDRDDVARLVEQLPTRADDAYYEQARLEVAAYMDSSPPPAEGVSQVHVDALCEELRAVLDDALAAGNEISSTENDSFMQTIWMRASTPVLANLSNELRSTLAWTPETDPHYGWLGVITCRRHPATWCIGLPMPPNLGPGQRPTAEPTLGEAAPISDALLAEGDSARLLDCHGIQREWLGTRLDIRGTIASVDDVVRIHLDEAVETQGTVSLRVEMRHVFPDHPWRRSGEVRLELVAEDDARQRVLWTPYACYERIEPAPR